MRIWHPPEREDLQPFFAHRAGYSPSRLDIVDPEPLGAPAVFFLVADPECAAVCFLGTQNQMFKKTRPLLYCGLFPKKICDTKGLALMNWTTVTTTTKTKTTTKTTTNVVNGDKVELGC